MSQCVRACALTRPAVVAAASMRVHATARVMRSMTTIPTAVIVATWAMVVTVIARVHVPPVPHVTLITVVSAAPEAAAAQSFSTTRQRVPTCILERTKRIVV